MTARASLSPALSTAVPWSTPRRYRAYRLAILAATLLYFALAQTTLRRAAQTLQTMGKDTAPSIIAAQEVSSSLADLDANAANLLLGTTAQAKEARRAFEARRTQTTERLVDAAENVTYGAEEKQPILTMVQNLGRYLELFGEAKYRHDAGDFGGALATYRTASQLMHEVILPAADDLDRANKRFMDAHYEEQQSLDGRAEWLAAFAGILLGGVLLLAQSFLFRRTRRIVNVPLAVATLLTFVYTVYAVDVFSRTNKSLRVAREDAFESIHMLWRARAIAYDANGDESRYLLDPDRAVELDRAFHDRVRRLTTSPTPSAAELSLLSRGKPPKFDGLFADELKNITFDGERAAALEMVKRFSRYISIDETIRTMNRNGQHVQAIQLCIGVGANESNAIFAAFDDALEKVVAINKGVFDSIVDEREHALKKAELYNAILAAAIALLTVFGFRPRLAEYAA